MNLEMEHQRKMKELRRQIQEIEIENKKMDEEEEELLADNRDDEI